MKRRLTMLLTASVCVFAFLGFKNIKTEDKISIDSIYISKSFTHNGVNQLNDSHYTIQVSLPYISQYVSQNVREQINKNIIKNSLGEQYLHLSPIDAVNAYIQEQSNFLLKKQANCPNHIFIHKIANAKIIEGKIICIENYFAENTEAIAQKTNFQNFDAKTGNLLEIKDIFKPNYEHEFQCIIVNSLKTAYESQYNKPIEAYKLMQLEQNINILQSFKLTEEGLSIYCELPKWFNGYTNSTSITIPYKSISKLLDHKYELV